MYKKVTNRFVNVWCGMDVVEFDNEYYIFAYPSIKSEDLFEALQDGKQESKVPESISVPFTIAEAKEHQKKYPEQTQFDLLCFPSSTVCDCGAAKIGSTHASWCSTVGN